MYGSSKATKPKNIGVKHYTENYLLGLEILEFNQNINKQLESIFDKLHNQKANEVKEELK